MRARARDTSGSGRTPEARELLEQALILAQRLRDPVCLIRARALLGVRLMFLGELVSARTHLDQA